MATDFDAVKQTVDILSRSDLLDDIIRLMEIFQKNNIVPNDILGYDLYSYCYDKAKKFITAIEYGEKALSLSKSIEQTVAIKSNLAKIYLSANRPFKSKEYYEFVLENIHNNDNYLLDYSAALFACNKKNESYDILKSMEEQLWKYDQKTADSILFNLGVHYIQDGEFKKGMEYLYVGRKLNVFGSYSKVWDIPEWNGKSKENLHILMVGEGGIGDEIINVRFVKHLIECGMKVSIMTTHKVNSIYSHLPFEKIIDVSEYKKEDYDCWTPMMALPRTLGVDSHELWYGPYLQAKPEYIEKHKLTGDFKVGLRWAGNPRYDHELHRSVNLTCLIQALPENNNWSLYSIQRDVGLDQLQNNKQVVDMSKDLESFDDLLGVIYNLDLVITSCTSVAHAAAAMGKPVIILIPIMEYYVWAEGKPTSSWYGDNLRLIRQITPETWEEAYNELQNVLKEMK